MQKKKSEQLILVLEYLHLLLVFKKNKEIRSYTLIIVIFHSYITLPPTNTPVIEFLKSQHKTKF